MSSVRSVNVRLSANVQGYIAAMNSAGAATAAAMGKADRSVAGHSKGLALLGKSAAVGGLAVAGGLMYAVKTAADFDQAMSKVQAATGRGGAGLKALREAAIQAGADTAFSASEAAGGIENLAKAGVSSKNILGGGLRGALDLAAAGELGVADAAEIAATAMTQFKLRGSEVPHVADLLAAGAGKAQGEVSDLAAALNQAGLVAAGSGLSIEETTGTLAAFASAGLTGSDAGTSFKTMLQRLQAPIGAGAKEMARLNVSAYDAQGNFIGMSKVADQLRDRLRGMTSEQRDAALATIFGSDAVRAARVLYDQGGKGIDKWTKAVDDQGFAARTAGTKLNNLKGDLEQLGGSFETAMIKLGTGAQSPLRGVVQDITGEINRLSKNGSLERWGNDAGDALRTVVQEGKPLAAALADVFTVSAHAIGGVAHAFNALPKDLRTLLIGGGVAAVAGKKLGLGGLGGKVLGGVTGNALGGKGGVVPVFVTNPGLGGPGGLGKGAGGAAGGAAAGAATGWAATIKSSVKSALPKILPLALKLAPLTFAAGASGSTFGPDVNGVRQGPGGLPWMKGPTSTLAPAEMQGWDSKQIKEYNDALAASKVNLEVLREPFRGVLQAVTEIGFGATMSGDRLVYAGMSAKDFSQGLQSLPKGVQTRVETPGAITSLNDVKALTTLYDLTPKQVRTLMELVGANKANAEVGRLAKAYHLTPRQVRTLVQEAGAKPSAEKIRALAQLYHRTPKQIRTLLAAVDQASGKARAAQKAARELVRTFEAKLAADDNSTPKARAAQRAGLAFARAAYRATLFAKDDASPKARAAREKAAAFAKKYLATLAANNGTGPGVSAARAAVNSVHDRTVTITTNYVVNRTVRTLQAAGKRLPQADGGMFDGNTQTFADGGYTDDGRYVPRIPQIRRGGGNVLWSEPETGWEAYISGKPGMRERNLDILTQAADRLGARVERRYADGGVHAAAKGRLNPNLDRLIKAVREARRDGLVSARDAHYVIAQIQKNHSTKGLRDELNKFIKQLNQARSKGFNGDTIDYLNQQFAGHPGGGGKAGKIKRGFDLKGGMTVADINAEFAELRKALHLSRNAFGGLRKEADRVAHAYSRNTAALEKSRDKLNQLRADRAAYASEVTGAFRHDPFGNGAAGLKLQLEADRNDAKAALDYAKVLNGKGISDALEKALFASGDLTTISQLAGMSKAQIAEYNKLYAASQATTKAVGTFEANQAYGKQINAQNVLIRRQTRVLDNLAKRIEGIERAAERGVARGLAGHVRKTNQRAKAGR